MSGLFAHTASLAVPGTRSLDTHFVLEEPLTADIVFALHRAVQTEPVTDIYKPQGAWKLEPNGTYAIGPDGEQVFIEYALPVDVPSLTIPQGNRRQYIQMLANYQIGVGRLSRSTGVWPEPAQLSDFSDYCRANYASTRELVAAAFTVQCRRT